MLEPELLVVPAVFAASEGELEGAGEGDWVWVMKTVVGTSRADSELDDV